MFQTHSEWERYNFCPHVAYIQNRKDRILKKNDWSGVFDRYCVRFSKEAKISLGCHSQGCNILGSWIPNLSKGSQVPVGLRGRSLWETNHMGWSRLCFWTREDQGWSSDDGQEWQEDKSAWWKCWQCSKATQMTIVFVEWCSLSHMTNVKLNTILLV